MKTTMYKHIMISLFESGINFDEIPKEDILKLCESYNGKISNDTYNMVVAVINSFCK